MQKAIWKPVIPSADLWAEVKKDGAGYVAECAIDGAIIKSDWEVSPRSCMISLRPRVEQFLRELIEDTADISAGKNHE